LQNRIRALGQPKCYAHCLFLVPPPARRSRLHAQGALLHALHLPLLYVCEAKTRGQPPHWKTATYRPPVTRPHVATRFGSGRDGTARRRDLAVARPPTHPPLGCGVCVRCLIARCSFLCPLRQSALRCRVSTFFRSSVSPLNCFLYGAARDLPPFARVQKCRGPPLARAAGFFSFTAGPLFHSLPSAACVFSVIACSLQCSPLSRISGMLL
jgi:hypothetical protein